MTTAVVAVTFTEMERLAEAIASSGLFGMKTPAQALALMAIAQAEGQHPALAARDYHVIQGRPTLKADAMLARFQSAGGKMTMKEYTDTRVVADFTHPQGGTVTIEWDTERAKRAGLTGKDVWKQYPRQMLRARVISEGIRTVFPGATAGLLVTEEAADLPPENVERDITPAKPATGVAALTARLAEIAPEATKESIAAVAEHIASGGSVKVNRVGEGDAFELTPPTIEEQVLAGLRDAALEGQTALKDTWEGLTKELRKTLSPHLASLKDAAAKAEAAQAEMRG